MIKPVSLLDDCYGLAEAAGVKLPSPAPASESPNQAHVEAPFTVGRKPRGPKPPKYITSYIKYAPRPHCIWTNLP